MSEYATEAEARYSPWVVVDDVDLFVKNLLANGHRIEGMSIFTTDGKEVVGCSEWMRAHRETFDHIVGLHNEWLKNVVQG